MNLITVVPISRQKLPPTLTYFTAEDVPVGAVVSIPVRAKSISAIVTASRAATDLKAEIRNAPFTIKKLGRVNTNAFFTSGFLDACRTLSDYYATSLGAVIGSVVPEIILENVGKIAPPLPAQASMLESPGIRAQRETKAVQGDEGDRMSAWRSLIRQEFARKRSVVIYAPTIEDVERIWAMLEKGIEGYIFFLHGNLSKKKTIETWRSIADTNHSIVVVATPSYSVLPRSDIDSVILERENGRGWFSMKSPYIDLRRALETIHTREGRDVYLSDTLLGVETLYRLEEHEISHGDPFKWRSISTATDRLIDMRRPATSGVRESRTFRIIGDELGEIVRQNTEENSNLFVLTSRRGLATVTVCDDCENLVSCDGCSAPMVLHPGGDGSKNFFLCHACGKRRTASDTCTVCGGHRLSPLGIGTDRVVQEIRRLQPDAEVWQADIDTAKTAKRAKEIVGRWRSKPGSILVGTETVLQYVENNGQVDHVAVASIDSMFALPDFRIEERIMHLLLRIRSISAKTLTIETRRSGEKVFEYGLKGNLSDFYRAVMAERRKFGYPPFSNLIKIGIKGKKDDIARRMGELRAEFSPYEIEVFPVFTKSQSGLAEIHGLMKINAGEWPVQALVEKLRALPPEITFKINPESLL